MSTVPEQLFGKVSPRKSGSSGLNRPLDSKKLTAPMAYGGHGRVFCRACGKYTEIDKDGVRALITRAKENHPSTPDSGQYFLVESCYACNDTNRFKDPQIIQIH